jgi:PLP dependent protein
MAISLTLVGVTKFADVAAINEALAAGLKNIGENKVQQAQEKFSQLSPEYRVTKHFIGHLQTNKVKEALKLFDMIQSVDSLRLAGAIDKEAAKLNRTVDILVQVNTFGEEQKFGVSLPEAPELIRKISEKKNLCLKGLMTIAPFTEDEQIIRKCFRDLKNFFDQISKKFDQSPHVKMKYLSMGMTADYRIALQEGSNMIRVGRRIFSE